MTTFLLNLYIPQSETERGIQTLRVNSETSKVRIFRVSGFSNFGVFGFSARPYHIS